MANAKRALAVQPSKSHTIHLDTARQAYAIRKPGIHCWLVDASDPNVTIDVAINSPDAQPQAWKIGRGFRHWPFELLYCSWAAQPDQWVEFAIAGEVEDWNPQLFEVVPPIPAGASTIINPTTSPVPVDLRTDNLPGAIDITGEVRPADFVPATGVTAIYHETYAAAATWEDVHTVAAGKVAVLSAVNVWTPNGMGYVDQYRVIDDAAQVRAHVYVAGMTNKNAHHLAAWEQMQLAAGWKVQGYVANKTYNGALCCTVHTRDA
jgi:hypothetical protein